jgi:hypothetical protein
MVTPLIISLKITKERQDFISMYYSFDNSIGVKITGKNEYSRDQTFQLLKFMASTVFKIYVLEHPNIPILVIFSINFYLRGF